MKKLILTNLIIFSSLFLLDSQVVHAHMGMMYSGDEETAEGAKTDHAESVETVLQDILKSQNVSAVQELDLSKISDDDWERLGDAVMELRHSGEAHEVMDRMMGGEGSENLRQMHINMGRAYLGYGRFNCGSGMRMGRGMMGYGNNRGFSTPGGMMGFGPATGYGGFEILCAVTWIVTIAFMVSGTYFFFKKAHKK